VPNQVTYFGNPVRSVNHINPNFGLYAQDQWTLKRLTTNVGLRFDYFRESIPDESAAPTQFIRISRFFQGQEVVNWKDLSPRLGWSFDLFGDGKTAVKASMNRYVLQQGVEYAVALNPIESNNSNRRQWTDANNDRIVQGDPFNDAANLELGPSQNTNFGKPVVSAFYDPEWAFGFAKRPAQWEFSTGVQRELMAGVSVTGAYFRRIYNNFQVNYNRLQTNADYDEYCVTAPSDARLPNNVRGQVICGLYDLNPSKVGAIDSYGTSASNFGKQYNHWNGGDLTMNARRSRLLLQGGLSTGKTMTDNCAIKPNSPSTRFCHNETPFLTYYSFLTAYTLPYDVQVSATYRNIPGQVLTASATFTNAQVSFKSPQRTGLSTGANATVALIESNTIYLDRQQQFDMRLARTFRVKGAARLQAQFDLYNAVNLSQITSYSTTYGVTTGPSTGSAWQLPTGIISPRIVKFGIQANF